MRRIRARMRGAAREAGWYGPLGQPRRAPFTVTTRIVALIAVAGAIAAIISFAGVRGAASSDGGSIRDIVAGLVPPLWLLLVLVALCAIGLILLLAVLDTPMQLRVTWAQQAARLGRARRQWVISSRAAVPVLALVALVCAVVPAPVRTHDPHGWFAVTVGAVWKWAPYALGLALLLMLFRWGREVRQRISVHPFVDGSRSSKEPDPQVAGLSTLLVAELARLNELHRAVALESTKFRDPGKPLPRMQTNEEPLLAPADVGDSTMEVYGVKLPLRTIVALFERLARGPRLGSTVYQDDDGLRVVAQLSGREARTWQVEMSRSKRGVRQGLQDLVTRLAHQIHADLYLEGQVNYRAADAFLGGLEACQAAEQSRLSEDEHRERAERHFLAAVTADRSFGLAYYDLGVVYAAQDRDDAAAAAFLAAIERRSDDWRPHYALSLTRVLQGRELLEPSPETHDRWVRLAARDEPGAAGEARRVLGLSPCAPRPEPPVAADRHETARRERAVALLRDARTAAARVQAAGGGFARMRGLYLEGLCNHFLGVAALDEDSYDDARMRCGRAARSLQHGSRVALRLLRREARRRGTLDVWQRAVASDLLARLGESHALRASTPAAGRLARARRRLWQHRVRNAFRAAIRLDPHDGGLRRRYGDAELRSGRLGLAVPELEIAVRLRPDRESHRQRLIEALRQRGQQATGVQARRLACERQEQVRALLTTAPRARLRTLQRLALSLVLGGERDEALKVQRIAAERRRLELGQGVPVVTRDVRAMRDLRRALEEAASEVLPPPAATYVLALDARNLAEAARVASHGRADGRDVGSDTAASVLLVAAIGALNAAFPSGLDPRDDEGAVHLGNRTDLGACLAARLVRFLAADDAAAARRLAADASRVYPLSGEVRQALGELSSADPRAADGAWRAAVLLDPALVDAYASLGRSSWRRADEHDDPERRLLELKSAERQLKRALRGADGVDAATRNLGQLLLGTLYLRIGRHAQARTELACVADPPALRGLAQLRIAESLILDGRLGKAVPYLHEAQELAQRHGGLGPRGPLDERVDQDEALAIVACSLALVHSDQDDASRALQEARARVGAVRDGDAQRRVKARLHLAEGEQQRRRSLKDAIESFKASVHADPTAIGYLRLAEAEVDALHANHNGSADGPALLTASASRNLRSAEEYDLSGAYASRIARLRDSLPALAA